eukprot:10279109-Ditylum_brightwellii.AAC.1
MIKEIHKQKELEHVCMKEVSNRSRLSEKMLLMASPLVDLLEYKSITECADEILLSTTNPLPETDKYT